jgi:hypothetical protein
MNSGSDALRAHGFTLHQRRDGVSRIHPTITSTYDVIEDVSVAGASLSPEERKTERSLSVLRASYKSYCYTKRPKSLIQIQIQIQIQNIRVTPNASQMHGTPFGQQARAGRRPRAISRVKLKPRRGTATGTCNRLSATVTLTQAPSLPLSGEHWTAGGLQ